MIADFDSNLKGGQVILGESAGFIRPALLVETWGLDMPRYTLRVRVSGEDFHFPIHTQEHLERVCSKLGIVVAEDVK